VKPGNMKLTEYDYASANSPAVFADVMSGNIAVLHGVLTEAEASNAVSATLEYSNRSPAFDTKSGSVSPIPGENFHRIDNNPQFSKSKHIFHTFNFEDVPALNLQAISIVFDRLLAVDNALMGERGAIAKANGLSFHPQIINYPRGGGFFARHTHPLEPQKIGLIASLTKKGEHFDTGGTLFWNNEIEVDAEPVQTIGSVTLFRFDLPHAVSTVDPDKPLEFGKPNGRWVAVLPYR
jgi:hypothetical protein